MGGSIEFYTLHRRTMFGGVSLFLFTISFTNTIPRPLAVEKLTLLSVYVTIEIGGSI